MSPRDYYLRTTGEAEMLAILRSAGLTYTDEEGWERPAQASHAHALDWIGTIHAPGEYGEGGEEISPPVAKPGFHANLRWLGDGEPHPAILVVAIPEPVTPERVWA